MSLSDDVTRVLSALRAFSAPDVFNPWADVDPIDLDEDAPLARRNHLRQHLRCDPKLLLVGEAPGYQGCHFTGVAFTSEKLVHDGAIPRLRSGRITKRPTPWAEPTATVVWRALYEAGIEQQVVCWNAFAFHPHQTGDLRTNRAPTTHEVLLGSAILRDVIAMYPTAKIVAVGKVAKHTLLRLGYACYEVRHPSMGGATLFRTGLSQILAEVAA